MTQFDDYYSGCTLLQPVSDKVGIGIDRLNFVVCQLTALCIAFGMRKFLHPSSTSITTRHTFSFVVGLTLSYFCFGNEILHLLAVSTTCYIVMKLQNTKTMPHSVFAISVGYLLVIHLKRYIYNYGAYNLDITGPLMVMVQRISGLAYSVHDGLACDFDSLTPYRKKYVTKKNPSFIEYFGYMFQFQSILAGPNILFKDYIQFIDGSNFKSASVKGAASEPSAVFVVLRKIVIIVLSIVVYLKFAGRYSLEVAKDPRFLEEWSPLQQMAYLVAGTSLTRFMYYHAWILAEAVCNASGLGFNGYDEKGNAKWDLATNVDIMGFELSNNMRSAINSWNTGTNVWLRFLVYERLEKYESASSKTIFTFLLSAVWHGVYPGYYLCFLTAALLVSSARSVRKFVRPYFLSNRSFKYFYDFLTFVVTKLAIAYFTFPFVMYSFWPAVLIYKKMFFFFHIVCLSAMFGLPALRKSLPKPPKAVVE